MPTYSPELASPPTAVESLEEHAAGRAARLRAAAGTPAPWAAGGVSAPEQPALPADYQLARRAGVAVTGKPQQAVWSAETYSEHLAEAASFRAGRLRAAAERPAPYGGVASGGGEPSPAYVVPPQKQGTVQVKPTAGAHSPSKYAQVLREQAEAVAERRLRAACAPAPWAVEAEGSPFEGLGTSGSRRAPALLPASKITESAFSGSGDAVPAQAAAAQNARRNRGTLGAGLLLPADTVQHRL